MFLPENIDLGNALKYTLTIRLKPDGFSFLIQDNQDKDIFTYQETAFSSDSSLLNDIQRIIFDLNFLTDNFARVNVVVVSPDYEMIPNTFFDKKDYAGFYKFTHSNKSSEHILISEQALPECVSVFGFDNEIYLFLMRSLYAPYFYHHSSLLTDYFSSKLNDDKKNSLFVNLHGRFADVICFKANGTFIHAMTYEDDNDKDLSYYILNVWEKCNFDQFSDYLYIYGYPMENNLEPILRKYVKEVRNVGLTDLLTDFGEKAQTVPLDILNLSR